MIHTGVVALGYAKSDMCWPEIFFSEHPKVTPFDVLITNIKVLDPYV